MAKRVRESRARFIHEPLQSKRKFDPRSFRTKVSRAHRITFGCPKGKYSPSTELCKVPVQIQKILHPMEEAMLSNPCPLSKNPFPTGLRRRESWKTGRKLVTKKKFDELVKDTQYRYRIPEKEARGWIRERYTTSLREKIFEGWGDPREISSSRKRELVERFKGAYPGIYAKFSLEGIRKKSRPEDVMTHPKKYLKREAPASSADEFGHPRKRNPKRRPLIERASYYKWYVGIYKTGGIKFFKSKRKPEKKLYPDFRHVIGPFSTRIRAADYALKGLY